MGDFTAVRQHVYSAGAIIVAGNHNDNENEIYQEHNNAFHATTGHGHTGATGDGKKLDSTGLDLTATYAWSGAHTHTANLNLHSGADLKVYSDAGTTLKFTVDGATGNIGVESGAKIFVDGTSLSGNSYIYESSSDVMRFVVGGNTDIAFTPTLVSLGAHDITVSPTYKLYLDGGANTYIQEVSSDLIQFVAGGNGSFYVGNNYAAVDSTDKFYLDGGSNTYIYESSADAYGLVVGGTTMMQCQNNGTLLTTIYSDVNIPSTKKLYFDGGSDTYDTESSANVLDRYVGGNKMLSCTSSTIAATASSLISMNVNSDTSITLGPTYITIDGDVMSLGVPFMTINADSNTASNQSVTKITGSNSGAGYAAAIDLTDVGTNLDYAFVMPADGTALGAYSGRIPIRVGANTRYIPYYV